MIEHSGSPHYEALNLQNVATSENDADLVRSYCGGFFPEGSTHEEKSTCTEALDRGFFEYGYVVCLIHESIFSKHFWLVLVCLHQFLTCVYFIQSFLVDL